MPSPTVLLLVNIFDLGTIIAVISLGTSFSMEDYILTRFSGAT
jgi:hypothetical protein